MPFTNVTSVSKMCTPQGALPLHCKSATAEVVTVPFARPQVMPDIWKDEEQPFVCGPW